MKKAILFCLILLSISGCVQKTPLREKADAEIPEVKELMALPDHPGEDDEIFVVANDDARHEELWKEFLEKTGKGEYADLIVACYTIEGDVIYEMIRYDGTGYAMFYDNSRDRFGTFSERCERKQYIYDLDYLSEEEIDDRTATFRNHYGFLSDTIYENQEELKAAFEEMRQGKEIDLLFVFGDSHLYSE